MPAPGFDEPLDILCRGQLSTVRSNRSADEFRAPLGLFEDLPDVFAEDRNGQQLQASEEQDEYDDGRDPVRDVGAHELVNDLNGEGQKGDEGEDPARIG